MGASTDPNGHAARRRWFRWTGAEHKGQSDGVKGATYGFEPTVLEGLPDQDPEVEQCDGIEDGQEAAKRRRPWLTQFRVSRYEQIDRQEDRQPRDEDDDAGAESDREEFCSTDPRRGHVPGGGGGQPPGDVAGDPAAAHGEQAEADVAKQRFHSVSSRLSGLRGRFIGGRGGGTRPRVARRRSLVKT